jgi:type IV pilus assembly protein PilY1
LAAGGKGYFVLDVTDPKEFSISSATVGNLVIMDTTATSDADIGHIFSPPVVDEAIANMSRQIVKLNNDRWAVVLGNGYNSTNEAPVLLVQYLDGTRDLLKISPCSLPTSGTCTFKGTNGLSSPQLIDINGDGKVDVAYAGDLQGNLWKFDLSSKTATDWKTSFDSKPLFVAQRGTDTAPIKQAFTTAPYWLPHPKGGIMLAIATGRNLSDTDRATTSTETIYALHDNSTFKVENGVIQFDAASADAKPPTGPINTGASTTLPTTLVQQTISATPLEDAGTSYFTSSNNPVDYDGQPAVVGPPAKEAVPPKRGWYLDFPLAGQRALQNIRNFSGQRIMVQSLIPKIGSNSTEETCSASATTERSFQAVLNMFTGTPAKTPAFSFEDTVTFTKEEAQKVTMVESAAGDTTLIRSEGKTKLLSSNCPPGQVCNAKDFNPGNYSGIRAGFRQLQ